MSLIQELSTESTLTKIGFTLTVSSIVFIIINVRAIINQNNHAIRSERNERFKNAIDQLGSEKNAIVLGGIYTLHRVAKKDKSYRENVFNILCSYVRDTTTTVNYKTKYKEKPSSFIQTILNILCINEEDFNIYRKTSKKNKIYRKTHLSNLIRIAFLKPKKKLLLDFSNAYLVGANLKNAYLFSVTLTNAKLTNADLRYATLINADLSDANLINAKLIGAKLTNVNLSNAKLTNADLRYATLINADLYGATLTNTNLWNANLISVTSLESNSFSYQFEKDIMAGIGRETDLSGIKGDYDKDNPPFEGEPIVGSYNEEEAKEMIEEYNKSQE